MEVKNLQNEEASTSKKESLNISEDTLKTAKEKIFRLKVSLAVVIASTMSLTICISCRRKQKRESKIVKVNVVPLTEQLVRRKLQGAPLYTLAIYPMDFMRKSCAAFSPSLAKCVE